MRFSIQGRAFSASIHGQGSLPLTRADQPLGDRLLGPIEARQEDAGGLADVVGDHSALGQFQIEGGADQLLSATSSNSSASGIRLSVGSPQWPSSIASVSA